jgi:hypothetical protein
MFVISMALWSIVDCKPLKIHFKNMDGQTSNDILGWPKNHLQETIII